SRQHGECQHREPGGFRRDSQPGKTVAMKPSVTSSRRKGSADLQDLPAPRTEPSMKVPSLRPPLKWAGGKRWQLPHLRPFWMTRTHRRLVEPFCGGLAVALGLAPERALLN